MRYFFDTEYNGFGGALLSLALVPEDGGEEFYVTIACPDPLDPWVERNVIPYLDTVPRGCARRASRAAPRPRRWRNGCCTTRLPRSSPTGPRISPNWRCCSSPVRGKCSTFPPLTLRFEPLQSFSTAANSAVPHNALHDARALRDHLRGINALHKSFARAANLR